MEKNRIEFYINRLTARNGAIVGAVGGLAFAPAALLQTESMKSLSLEEMLSAVGLAVATTTISVSFSYYVAGRACRSYKKHLEGN